MNNSKGVRTRSLEIIDSLGYKISSSLPLLESLSVRRDDKAIMGRMLSLYGVVALSFGWDHRLAAVTAWLAKEGLVEYMTPIESKFTLGDTIQIGPMQSRIEALFALAWACDLAKYSILDPVPKDFVALFPSIARATPTADFRNRIRHRASEDIFQALDLLYCLNSAKTDLYLRGEVDQCLSCPNLCALQQRRWALEWLISEVEWEEIELDT